MNDLGDFYHCRGDLPTAFKYYVSIRDYTTTNRHVISMCLNAIRVGVEMRNYNYVRNFATKAEQTHGLSQVPTALCEIRIASGLAALDACNYKLAARKLIEAASTLVIPSMATSAKVPSGTAQALMATQSGENIADANASQARNDGDTDGTNVQRSTGASSAQNSTQLRSGLSKDNGDPLETLMKVTESSTALISLQDIAM